MAFRRMWFVCFCALFVHWTLIDAQYYLRDQTLGCDGVIGSGKKLDRCGDCGGTNSGCKIISGIYIKRTDKAAYEYITEFPIGASHINITEARNTRNYLALRYSNGLRSIINGNWSLDWSGNYNAAGTVVKYTKPRHQHIGENIYIQGPLREEIQLLLLVQTRNPGIYYQYTLPVEDRSYGAPSSADIAAVSGSGTSYNSGHSLPQYVGDSLGYGLSRQRPSQSEGSAYQWKTVDRGRCSRSCGEGFRVIDVVCLLISSQVTVTEENCLSSTKPQPDNIPCNTHTCRPEWEADKWSECTATCGHSTQTRQVSCKTRLSSTQSISVYAWNCDSSQKPSTVKMCPEKECYTWAASSWSECSIKCGSGTRERTVRCVDSQNIGVDDGLCLLSKPRHVEKCYSTCEESWFHSKWSNQCAEDCSVGSQTRRLFCPADEGRSALTSSKCGNKPESVKACESRPECVAAGKWFTGEWSNCRGHCDEAYQSRDVVCMIRGAESTQVAAEVENCVEERRPSARQRCHRADCNRPDAVWFTTDWSQCSVTCGDGYQRRQVKCIRSNLEDDGCLEVNKPAAAKTCSAASCPQVTITTTADPNCTDKYRSCSVVVQARLCKLAYYNKICCKSCRSANP